MEKDRRGKGERLSSVRAREKERETRHGRPTSDIGTVWRELERNNNAIKMGTCIRSRLSSFYNVRVWYVYAIRESLKRAELCSSDDRSLAQVYHHEANRGPHEKS